MSTQGRIHLAFVSSFLNTVGEFGDAEITLPSQGDLTGSIYDNPVGLTCPMAPRHQGTATPRRDNDT